jgi:hypothetical protein
MLVIGLGNNDGAQELHAGVASALLTPTPTAL